MSTCEQGTEHRQMEDMDKVPRCSATLDQSFRVLDDQMCPKSRDFVGTKWVHTLDPKPFAL